MEDRNIIDDIVENDHNDQAIQLAWTWSGSQICARLHEVTEQLSHAL